MLPQKKIEKKCEDVIKKNIQLTDDLFDRLIESVKSTISDKEAEEIYGAFRKTFGNPEALVSLFRKMSWDAPATLNHLAACITEVGETFRQFDT